MPVALFRKAFAEASATVDKEQFPRDIIENALRRIAETFDIPIFAAKQHARQNLSVDDTPVTELGTCNFYRWTRKEIEGAY